MDALTLARWQFGITTVYHFFFVPLTLGLSVIVALMETLYVRSGNELYLRMTRFWGSDEWRGDLYQEVPTLFGTVEVKRCATTGKRLGELYKRRLSEVFPAVSEPLVMTNSMNGPLYCLIAASHHPVGVKIVNDIFGRYERLGRQAA